MEKDRNQSWIDPPTLLLIHQLIAYQMKIHDEKKNRVEANLRRIGGELGTRIMMKVSNGHSSRTKDTPAILKLFASEFWQFAFGKKAQDIVVPNANSITFKDGDFELITRVSGENTLETNIFADYIEIFCVALFQSALKFLDLKAEVVMKKMDKFTIVEVTCV